MSTKPPPWENLECTPEKLLDFIQRYERVAGKQPELKECVAEFSDKKLGVLICLWELDRRGLICTKETTRA